MKVLVTGGRGMIGRAVLRALEKNRPDAEVLAPNSTQVDFRDAQQTRNYLQREKFDLVVHIAAKVGGIGANVADPVGFLVENLLINAHLIEAAHQSGVRDLLYLGSSCMYPKDFRQPLREEDLLAAPLEPTNEGYALAKITGAKQCEYHNTQHGTHYKTLIPCNIYGPYDRFDLRFGHLVASAIMKVHQAKQTGAGSIEMWGDGSVRREFLYVDDLAEFIVAMCPRLSELPDYLNVGYGEDHTVLEYYRAAQQAVGYECDFDFNLNKPVGMIRKLMDSSPAKALGWNPPTTVPEGVTKAYDWFLQNVENKITADGRVLV